MHSRPDAAARPTEPETLQSNLAHSEQKQKTDNAALSSSTTHHSSPNDEMQQQSPSNLIPCSPTWLQSEQKQKSDKAALSSSTTHHSSPKIAEPKTALREKGKELHYLHSFSDLVL
ncbi:hypothetical protein MRB53_014207 [Persea americana]|uniref:Uncharacterized protein n=1 Tax=Persea americana TaxID=3435 RepID=A0ACC2KAJ1_PERAE|nr:hypothetical protein MRB53_014207 [Persea americana]